MLEEDYISNLEILRVLAERIKEYRLACRLSQREMAEKSGVSYTTVL